MKPLDLSRSVYDLVKEYPELQQIMYDLGFTEINKKAMLHSVGKIMTIPKGAQMKGISMADVIGSLQEHGFEIAGATPAAETPIYNKVETAAPMGNPRHDHAEVDAKEGIGLLKSYHQRLS